MNKKASLCSIVVIMLVTVLSFAAEEKAAESKAAQDKSQARQPRRAAQQADAPTPARPVRPGLGRGPMNPDARSQAYARMMAQQGSSHEELIKELLELKKVAQEENATKTIAAIEALIEAKTTQYKQEQVEQEKRREEFRQRMQERMNRQRPAAGSAGTESPSNPSSSGNSATRTNQN